MQKKETKEMNDNYKTEPEPRKKFFVSCQFNNNN